MSLELQIVDLVAAAKLRPKARYLMWANVNGQEFDIGETTLGPTSDIALTEAALLTRFTSVLSGVPITSHEISDATPFLCEWFDASAALEEHIKNEDIQEGDLILVDTPTWKMLRAQGFKSNKVGENDAEISFKGWTVQRSAAS